MQNTSARLNDVCVNGLAQIFRSMYSERTHSVSTSANRCTLFSTYDLPMVRYRAQDADFWHRTRSTEYWAKDIWILLIHRPRPVEHWVLCIISPHTLIRPLRVCAGLCAFYCFLASVILIIKTL